MKAKLMTIEFWAALISGGLLIVVTLGLVSQEEATTVEQLLIGLVAAVLPIVALVLGYSEVRATRSALGLIGEGEVPAYETAEFWMTLVSTVTMVLVAGRIITQEQSDMWVQLIAPLVAAVLPIAAYIKGRLGVQSGVVRGIRGIRGEM